MLNSSNSVVFKATPSDTKTIDVASVLWGFEFINGKTETYLGGKKEEENNGHRKTIDIRFWADSTLSAWFMTNFLPSTTKTVRIDSVDYAVVIEGKKVTFNHVKHYNYLADVKLKFSLKEPD